MKPTYALQEAAFTVGFSARTLRRAIQAGELKAAKAPGKAGRYSISAVELARWFAARGGGDLFSEEPEAEM